MLGNNILIGASYGNNALHLTATKAQQYPWDII